MVINLDIVPKRKIANYLRKILLEARDFGRLARLVFRKNRVERILIGFNAAMARWVPPFLGTGEQVVLGTFSYTTKVSRLYIRKPRHHFTLVSHGYSAPLSARRRWAAAKQLLIFEDGPVRGTPPKSSYGLEAPLSVSFDRAALHFDRGKVSDLDSLLNGFAPNEEPYEGALAHWDVLARRIANSGLPKFVQPSYGKNKLMSLPVPEEHVLVLGQVPGDRSLKLGRQNSMSFINLLSIAVLENPGVPVTFRPHPVVGLEHPHSKQIFRHGAIPLSPDEPLQEHLVGARRCYTFTSQSGFESALHGVPTTVFGCPFYAGWGFTDDRESFLIGKRTRALEAHEVAAVALLAYPKYLSAKDRLPCSPNRGLDEQLALHEARLENLQVVKHSVDDKPASGINHSTI